MLDDESLTALSTALRAREAVSDRDFDRLFPRTLRMRSHVHWTPVDVALRACTLLAPTSKTRVLDIGSGVGKVCLIGASITHASWVGIEADRRMVEAASAAAHLLGVRDRAHFICEDASSLDWSSFDSLYFFNPFAEVLFGSNLDAMPRRLEFRANLERARQQLVRMRTGATIVTYHGLGGEMPEGFDLVHREVAREDELCVWQRR